MYVSTPLLVPRLIQFDTIAADYLYSKAPFSRSEIPFYDPESGNLHFLRRRLRPKGYVLPVLKPAF